MKRLAAQRQVCIVRSKTNRRIDSRVSSRQMKPDVSPLSSEARITQLLLAAKDIFTSKGFAATTMDDIASAAGMSKKTLYKLFESKTQLFRAMLLYSLPQFHFATVPLKGPPVSQLRKWLRSVADVAFAPDEIALHRLIISERQTSPELGPIFSEVILRPGVEGVVYLLKTTRLQPRLEGLPLPFVAEMLLGMVLGHDHVNLITDDGYRLNRRLLDRRIDVAISIFCVTEDCTGESPPRD